jgi:hypothetical protein
MNCRFGRPLHLALALTLALALPLTLLLTSAAPLAAADPELMRLTRSDANFLLGVRLADVAASPLVKTLLDEALASNPQWGAVLAMGSNPLAGFDEVLISANIDTQSPQEPKDALVLLRGTLDAARLEKVFCTTGCDREQYRGLDMIKLERKDADTPGYLVLLDAQYAALGERPAVLAAIDRHRKGTPASLSPAMQGWIDRLGRYHLWVAARGPFHAPQAAEPGPASMAFGAASKMEGFGLGLLLESDVSLAVELESSSDQDSTELYEMVQGLLALGRMSQQRDQAQAEPGAFDLLENLKLTNAGRVVSASLTIPQRELTKQLRAKIEQRQQPEPAVEAQLHPENTQAAAVRPAPRKRPSNSIRVYGLNPRALEYPLTPK